ncbi:MAG: hypothetical protein M1334_04320 [Patescibacteria group bacterium]|nr:hypothetical protein [Patescibacteria group bacterium]
MNKESWPGQKDQENKSEIPENIEKSLVEKTTRLSKNIAKVNEELLERSFSKRVGEKVDKIKDFLSNHRLVVEIIALGAVGHLTESIAGSVGLSDTASFLAAFGVIVGLGGIGMEIERRKINRKEKEAAEEAEEEKKGSSQNKSLNG